MRIKKWQITRIITTDFFIVAPTVEDAIDIFKHGWVTNREEKYQYITKEVKE